MTFKIVTDPVISLNDITKTFGDPNFDLTPTSTSPAPFSFTISNTNIAILNDNNVNIQNAGSTSIIVRQEAMENFIEATKSVVLTVIKADPQIVLNEIVKIYGDDDFKISPTSNSNGQFSFNIENPLIGSVNGDTISIL